MISDAEIKAELDSRNNENDADQWDGSYDPWFVDVATELLAAREVVEAARQYMSWVEGGMKTPGLPELVKLEQAIVTYDEATR